jgi:trehalose 6-phosphate phosphatase
MPKYLFNCLNDVRAALQSADRLVLFLDFDGTLAPIARAPALARLNPEMRAILQSLANDGHHVLAIVSGRSLTDLKRLVKIPEIIYAGNHGLEISGPGVELLHDGAARSRGLISEICLMLKKRLRPFKGTNVEMKGLSATIHYRLVRNSEMGRFRLALEKAILPFREQVRISDGKMAIEIRPQVEWNKGSAVRWIMNQLACDSRCALYMGDDRTDEDAFHALPHGVTVYVGTELDGTAARYFLKSPYGVFGFLEYLSLTKKQEADPVPAGSLLSEAAAR